MRSTRIAAAVAGAVILVGGLSACNNDDGKASGGGSSSAGGSSDAGGKQDPAQNPVDALKAAQEATSGKKTAKIDGSTTLSLAGKQVKQSTKGGLDWTQGMQMNVANTMEGGEAPVSRSRRSTPRTPCTWTWARPCRVRAASPG